MLRRLVCVLALLPLAAAAQIFLRTIPPGAVKAELQVAQDGSVLLNGKPYRLSPAAQIRGPQNQLMLTQSMGGKYVVRLQLDGSGSVHRVWVLTPEEAAVQAPRLR